jgi:protein-tyrosine phosphatase
MPWPFEKNKKPESFAEISPGGLFDAHAHLLPGLDDGPADLDESGVILDGLEALGYTAVAATPHFNNSTCTPDRETQQALIARLEQRRPGRGPVIHTGAEIIFDDQFGANEKNGVLPGIAGKRTYLVELGFIPGSLPPRLEAFVFGQTIKGITLILAHPERFPDLQEPFDKLRVLRRAGLLMQVDLLSLSGKYGRRVKKKAEKLLDEGLADLVASDLHRAHELPDLERALATLARRDADEFIRLTSTNPRALLAGNPDGMLYHD